MATAVSTAVLKAVPLFTSFPDDQLRMLTTMVTRRSAARVSSFAAKMMYESSELLNVESRVWMIESPRPMSTSRVSGTLSSITSPRLPASGWLLAS